MAGGEGLRLTDLEPVTLDLVSASFPCVFVFLYLVYYRISRCFRSDWIGQMVANRSSAISLASPQEEIHNSD